MDITAEILKQVRIQGGSDNTNPAVLSAAKCLNYATGASIHAAEKITISSIPFTIPFKDAIGLGADNTYIKFILDDVEARFGCFSEEGWECALITRIDVPNEDSDYEDSIIDETKDLVPDAQGYLPSTLNNSGPNISDKPRLSITLKNKGTGNIYQDKDFEAYVLNKRREPINDNLLWCDFDDYFYVGFHARNTKRIPYNVDVVIGNEVKLERNITTGELNRGFS